VKLGVTTTTDDAEGEVLSTRPVHSDRAAIEKALTGFLGEIDQIPPMYSAIKQEGQPLYKLARAGLTTERAPRRVHIHEIHLLDVAGDRVTLDVACSKGTYIRTLAHDLGEVLGCGGHVAELRRTGMGGFVVEEAVSLDALAALPGPAERRARLAPADQALRNYPAVTLTRNAAFYLLQGQAVTGGQGLSGWVRLYEDRGAEGLHFLGLGEATGEGQVAPRRLLHAPEAAENP
jgi:tRNA pseudouridine55 synthase